MRLVTKRILRIAAFGIAFVACTADRITAPAALPAQVGSPAADVAAASTSGVVISQVYGGGGNSGATYKNDFIELYNGSSVTVSVAGWSVQYASTTGTGWAATALTGSIAPGHYYLVQESAGAGGTTSLPTPDAAGSLTMASGAGKVALVNSTTLLTGSGCPLGLSVVDFVGYGTGTNCFEGSGPTIPSLSNTTAAIRKNSGQQDNNDNAADFANGAPTPRNTASAPPTGLVVTIAPLAPSAANGTTVTFTATATSGGSNVPITSATWSSSAPIVATIDPSTGVASTLTSGNTTIGVNVVTASGNASSSTVLTVPPPAVASIVVAPATATIAQGANQQFTATAYDASNTAVTGVTFTWASATTTVATVTATGLATGVAGGTSNIAATSGSTTGTATLTVTGVSAYTPPPIRFSELHYDNAGTDAGEGVEIEGPVGTSLAGWSVQLYDGSPTGSFPRKVYSTTAITGTLTAPIACGTRGVINIPILGIQNGGTAGAQPDGLALVDNNGVLVEFLSYEGAFAGADGAALGVTSRDIGVMEDNPVPAVGLSLHRSTDGSTWSAPSAADMGYVNACGGPPPSSITFSGRSPTADPALPVGFEAQVFASEKVGGSTVSTTFAWTSETPNIASIDNNGVLRALSAGIAVLRATATDGATATYSLPTIVGSQSAAPYGGNTEFGDPVDNDPSNDFIIRRLEYTSSFNPTLGRPNWVSEKLDATTYGPEDRCNCFTFDPELVAAGFAKYTTADYTGAGAFAGYGIDRGHMTRSADRTASNLDNARTYYFSNVLPQAAAVNQGNWAIMENYLGDFAKTGGKEVYVTSGGAGSKGTVKNEGKIDIPKYVWKVAVIMGAGKGLADVNSVNDLQVIAVVIPNDAAQTADWTTYKVTVDSVEALTGYDLLSKLPDNIEKAVESNDAPPVAAISGATTGTEGSSLAFSASGSTDADAGDVLTYTWTFGDGGTATGVAPSHTFADNGTYTVTVRATDSKDVYSEATMTTTITNIAPTAVFSTTPSSLTEGSSFTVALYGAADPSPTDLASLTYAFDCGDGAGFRAASSTSSVSCSTSDNGVRTVNARVMDKDGGATSYTGSVTVANAAPVITSFSAPAGTLTAATASVTFSDVGTADTHSVTFSWGDGQTSTVDAGLSGSATATHAYAATGFYTVSATVTDDDGASVSTSTQTLVVYNPTGGTLSGSGFLLGARGAKTYISGNISYAGGTTPTGTFAITGNDAANLTATSFDYLVVNGITATLKGSGTLTNGTPVTFLVRGLDNNRQDMRDRGLSADLAQGLPNQDYARVKVWNSATGAVVYDSQPGSADFATPTEMVRGGTFSIRP
jgi:DNA/RNA endonuclease G (NUC1)